MWASSGGCAVTSLPDLRARSYSVRPNLITESRQEQLLTTTAISTPSPPLPRPRPVPMPTQFDKLAEDAKHTRVENMAGLPRAGGGMPTSPFEIEATKEILQRRIENGQSFLWLLCPSAASPLVKLTGR